MTEPVRMAFSPCPNDTFVFHALVHGAVPGAPPVTVDFADVDVTNGAAEQGEYDLVKVSYAALPGDTYYDLCQRYLGGKGGAVFTFGVKGGYEAGKALVEGLELFSHLANIGDTRSLVIHPASTTHRQLTDEQRVAAGAGPDVVRLSVGIEDVKDIIADLEQSLSKI